MNRREAVFLCAMLFIVLFIGLGTENSLAVAFAGAGIPSAGLATWSLLWKRTRKPVPPIKQLQALSEEYGLPVITPLQKSEALPHGATAWLYEPHSCGGMYYQNAKFCPVHGGITVDMSGYAVTAPPAIAKPDPVPDDLSTYVPAGQAELSRDLYSYMGAQVQADVEAHGKRRLSASCWHIGPEWLKEVRKLKGPTGAPLFVSRYRQEKWQSAGTLFGYPVVIGDQYGVPELTALLSLVM